MMIDDIAVVLATAGHGTVGTTIFKGHLPATPDKCLSLFQYGGEPPALIRGANYEYPGLQVRSRSSNPLEALTMLDAVVTILHGKTEFTTTYARYLALEARQSPAPMGGLDDNGRTEYVVNFRVIMTRI
jgi:hypothetical protein